MKKFLIKPDCIDLFGPDANAYTVLTEDDVADLARCWEKPVDEIMEQLIEDDSDKHAYRPLYRFSGSRLTWDQLNRLIAIDSGVEEAFFETEDDYKTAIRDGFVTWDSYYTTVWVDD